jgi:hypothetical protein
MVASPSVVPNELIRLHTYGKTVSDSILNEIGGSNPSFDIEYHKVPAGKGSKSGFYQTAGLLVVESIESDELISLNPIEQVDWVAKRLERFHEILQSLSGIHS